LCLSLVFFTVLAFLLCFIVVLASRRGNSQLPLFPIVRL
jgi:hypothetical protein